MQTKIETQETNTSNAQPVTQKKSDAKQGMQIIDNRPNAISQRKSQEKMNSAPSSIIQKKPEKDDHGTWKSSKYDDIVGQPSKAAVKKLEEAKTPTPGWGKKERALKGVKHKLKKMAGVEKDKNLLKVYQEESQEKQTKKDIGISSMAGPAISAGKAVVNTGITLGGVAAAPFTAGASVPLTIGAKMGVNAGADKLKEKAEAHNNEKAKFGYSALNLSQRGEDFEETVAREDLEHEQKEKNLLCDRSHDSNVDWSQSPDKYKGKGIKGAISGAAAGAKKAVSLGVEAAADEFDPSGGVLAEYGGKAVKAVGKKAIDKGKEMANEKVDEGNLGGYGLLTDEYE